MTDDEFRELANGVLDQGWGRRSVGLERPERGDFGVLEGLEEGGWDVRKGGWKVWVD